MSRGSAKRPRKPKPGGGHQLVYLPLGGAGEIGMNLYLYGYGREQDRKWIMVDCGVTFADFRDPGIDIILPDITFIEQRRASLLAIVLTHAHEDHYGAVAHLWPRLRAPVYATPFCAQLLQGKLEETGLAGEVPVKHVTPGGSLSLGPFDISLIAMTHSIPETYALAIRTALGNVLHSGDWRIDRRPVIPPDLDEPALRAFGKEGCRALICDSTNAMREGTSPCESDVEEGLYEVIRHATGRVAVTTFASNFGRLLSVARAARRTERHVCLVGRSMHRVVAAARETGLIADFPEVLPEQDFAHIPRDKVLGLCTGSQGEPRAALSRIASSSHGNIVLEDGDLVIFSSRTIPGNEKDVAEVQNNLAALGVSIVTASDRLVHATGHPQRGDLQQLYRWLKPQIVVPMHGEMRHLLAHARFALDCGVGQAVMARNGEMIQLAPDPAGPVDEVASGRLHMDGRLLLPAGDGPARQRRRLSFSGALAITLVLDEDRGLSEHPQIAQFGLPPVGAGGDPMGTMILDAIDDVLEKVARRRGGDDAELAESVRRAVVRAVAQAWGKRPQCQVNIVHL